MRLYQELPSPDLGKSQHSLIRTFSSWLQTHQHHQPDLHHAMLGHSLHCPCPMEVSWELLVLVWCLLVGNLHARWVPPACSSQHLLCTWCLPSSRGGREIVWIHQGGSCDLPGIPHMGQSDWRFNCVLEGVPTGYNCTIKMFPGPKGKWQGMAHIWIEEISIPKLAAVKSPWLVLSREPCQGGERTEISLEIL